MIFFSTPSRGQQVLALAQEDALMAGNRDELNRCTVENSSLEGRIGVLNEQIRTEEMNEAHINSRREAISGDLESRKTQLAGYEEQKEQMDVHAEAMAGRLDEAARLLESRDELIHRREQEIELEKSADVYKRQVLTAHRMSIRFPVRFLCHKPQLRYY